MKAPLCAIVLVLLICCPPVMAEIYQYRDKAGRLHFTDDISRVPDDQRPQDAGQGVVRSKIAVEPELPAAAEGQEAAPEFTASESDVQPGTATSDASPTGKGKNAAGAPLGDEDQAATPDEGQEETRTPPDRRVAVTPPEKRDGAQTGKAVEDLEARNLSLKKEFQELMSEKDRLEGERSKLKSGEQRRAFADLVKQFNQKVDAYEAQRNRLNDEINVHNASVTQTEKDKKSQP